MCFISTKIMAEFQLKSSKRAPGCGHPMFDWDTQHFCYPCREKGKLQDVCITSKEEDCFNCLQFTSDQKRKLRSKKKAKEVVVSKEIEDNLLGQESDIAQRSPTAERSQSVAENPLSKILQRLDDMQSQITSLKASSSSTSSLLTPYQVRHNRTEESG